MDKAEQNRIIREHEEERRRMRALEDAYKAAEEETMGFKYDFGKASAAFDQLLSNLPDRIWIE